MSYHPIEVVRLQFQSKEIAKLNVFEIALIILWKDQTLKPCGESCCIAGSGAS
jgi:hypothetical protein